MHLARLHKEPTINLAPDTSYEAHDTRHVRDMCHLGTSVPMERGATSRSSTSLVSAPPFPTQDCTERALGDLDMVLRPPPCMPYEKGS